MILASSKPFPGPMPPSNSPPLLSMQPLGPASQTNTTESANQNSAATDKSSASPKLTSAGPPEREKPRLTEQEKKNNHIASEQKRRAAIREGFDRLTELVPGLAGQGRSEGMVLRKTVDFIRVKLQERQELIEEIEKRGGTVDGRARNIVENT
ncbi:hypothetical protein D8B26_005605 [Coccidioides posadasii str. Silveira]|nr:bHLH family transcription factor [Coccidioides posadasii C735 delta SOWgp]EER26847.1 bHLH family transcription factor [Coccidioides posadasii C735 delta SOWgp]QVM10954.1 hypothetical protein D8B26_005605 [Coccidioides posadasii str. Silveira]|eukprot:XP_003068992.1 bHLH family transcription factor [Coccidioides posadasii C735 delta SOWgp]